MPCNKVGTKGKEFQTLMVVVPGYFCFVLLVLWLCYWWRINTFICQDGKPKCGMETRAQTTNRTIKWTNINMKIFMSPCNG